MGKRRKSAVSEKGIRTRAYEIYIERGGSNGRALDDWLQAELEFENAVAKAASQTTKEYGNAIARSDQVQAKVAARVENRKPKLERKRRPGGNKLGARNKHANNGFENATQ